jgi:hypothetical protein
MALVELWGTIVDDRQREALIVAAENTAGVKEAGQSNKVNISIHEFRLLSALRLHRTMWRALGKAMALAFSSCVSARDTVSIVKPR